jgi:hypothetical protein
MAYMDTGLGMPGSSKGSAHPESAPSSQPGPVEKGTPSGGHDNFGYQALSYLRSTHPMFALASAITDAATGKTKGGFCGHQAPTGQGMAANVPGLDQSALAGTEYSAPEAPPEEVQQQAYED